MDAASLAAKIFSAASGEYNTLLPSRAKDVVNRATLLASWEDVVAKNTSKVTNNYALAANIFQYHVEIFKTPSRGDRVFVQIACTLFCAQYKRLNKIILSFLRSRLGSNVTLIVQGVLGSAVASNGQLSQSCLCFLFECFESRPKEFLAGASSFLSSAQTEELMLSILLRSIVTGTRTHDSACDIPPFADTPFVPLLLGILKERDDPGLLFTAASLTVALFPFTVQFLSNYLSDLLFSMKRLVLMNTALETLDAPLTALVKHLYIAFPCHLVEFLRAESVNVHLLDTVRGMVARLRFHDGLLAGRESELNCATPGLRSPKEYSELVRRIDPGADYWSLHADESDEHSVIAMRREIERYKNRIDALESTMANHRVQDMRDRKASAKWKMQLEMKVQHMDEERRKILLERTLAEERFRHTKVQIDSLNEELSKHASANFILTGKLRFAEKEATKAKSVLRRLKYVRDELESWRELGKYEMQKEEVRRVNNVLLSSNQLATSRVAIDRLERERNDAVDRASVLRDIVDRQNEMSEKHKAEGCERERVLQEKMEKLYEQIVELKNKNQKLQILVTR